MNDGITFEIEEGDGTLTVTTTVPRRVLLKDKKVSCTLIDVKQFLESNNIEHNRLIDKTYHEVSNFKNETLTGRWIFEKPKTTKTRAAKPKPKPKQRIAEKTKEPESPPEGRSKKPSVKSIRERTKAIANKRAKKSSNSEGEN